MRIPLVQSYFQQIIYLSECLNRKGKIEYVNEQTKNISLLV